MAKLHILLLAAFAVPALTHMIMLEPPIFGPVLNAPLNNQAENPGVAPNYPCKATNASYYDWSKSTSIAQGDTYSVQFQGQAVHGGGSCQFSLSKDKYPTVESEFKVIHSVIGQCPMLNTPGNAGDNAYATDPDQYVFTMNPKIEPGQYTFAWTWFNKLGNREMYMNCAPITVTAGSRRRFSSTRRKAKRDIDYQEWDKLPNMFVANNAAAPGCETNHLAWTIMFPDPGNDVEFHNDTFIYPNNYCEAPDFTPKQIAPSLAASVNTSFSLASYTAPTATATASRWPDPTTSPSQAAYVPPLPSAAPSGVPANPPGAAVTPGSSGTCLAGQQHCSVATGSLFCFSPTQWAICNNGCGTLQSVAHGTTCKDGKITAQGAGSGKMRHKHRRGHGLSH